MPTERKRKFEYKERSRAQYEERAKQKSKKREGFIKSGVTVFAPKIDETNKIRILPPTWDDPDHYGLDLYAHYNIGADNSAFLCLRKMKNEPCPICEAIDSNSTNKEFKDKVKAKRKVYVYLIDRFDEEAGVKVWTMPWTVDKEFVLQSVDEETGDLLKIDLPEEGYDVSFKTVKGSQGGPVYTYEGEKISRRPSPIFADPKKMDAVLDYIVEHPVTETLEYKEYDYIKSILDGGAIEEKVETDDDDDDLPIEPKKSKVENEEQEDSAGDYTYKDLKLMDREDLEDIATDECGMKRREIRELNDKELIEAICEELNIHIEKSSSKLEEAKAKLRGK